MKRRDFLKLIGLAPLAPSVLAAKEKYTGEVLVENLEPFEFLEADWTYLYIHTDIAISNDDASGCTLYGLGNDGKYVKIDNYAFVDNNDGTYNINIPEGVL